MILRSLFQGIQNFFSNFFAYIFNTKKKPQEAITADMRLVLESTVAFYRNLDSENRTLFEKRAMLFLSTTNIVGVDLEVDNKDRILVAASAIIPVWSFENWHYFNLNTVFLYPHSFNDSLEYKRQNSTITGMVGNGALFGKMFLSKPALHLGFSNSRDKQNVGIHEFVHLIDMMDGDCDGFPEKLIEYAYSIPWLNMIEKKIQEINNSESNIRDYGATNKVEFFAVASEYFFERPKMLKNKHPVLYEKLQLIYQQNTAEIKFDVNIKKKGLCPCGSGKRYKRCCLPSD
jgi:Mlc titration factor MtfA (ptsG expression regulator)